MKTITVNGEKHTLELFRERDVETGMVIGQRYGRRVYRVLCFDGDEVIARSVRNAGIIVAMSVDEVLDEFGYVTDWA